MKQLYLREIHLSKELTRSTTQRHETEIRNGNEKINEFIYDAADLTASHKPIIPE